MLTAPDSDDGTATRKANTKKRKSAHDVAAAVTSMALNMDSVRLWNVTTNAYAARESRHSETSVRHSGRHVFSDTFFVCFLPTQRSARTTCTLSFSRMAPSHR